MRGVDVLERTDGTLIALFESTYWLDRLLAEEPDLPSRSWWPKESCGSDRRPPGDRRPHGRSAVGPHPGGSAGADPVGAREQRKGAARAGGHRTAGVTMVLLGIAVVVVALVSWWSLHDDSAPPKTAVSGVSITAPSTVSSTATVPPTIPSTTQPTSNP